MSCLGIIEIERLDLSEHLADLVQIPRSGAVVEVSGGQVYREQ